MGGREGGGKVREEREGGREGGRDGGREGGECVGMQERGIYRSKEEEGRGYRNKEGSRVRGKGRGRAGKGAPRT